MSPSLQLPFIVEIEGGGCDVFVLGLLVVALALVALLLAVRHPVRTILSVGESKFPDFPTRPHTNRISGWKAAIAFLIGFVVISTVTLCHRNAFKSPSDLSKEHSDLSSNNRVDPLPEMSKDFSAKRTASTANFRIEFRNWQQARVVDGHDAPQILAPVPIVSRGDREPSLFVLAAYHKSSAKKAMWTSIPGRPFLQSAIGNDSLTPGNGEYRIVQSNRQLTNYQTIVDVRELAPGEGSDALRSHDRVIVQGQLLYTARPDKDEPKAVINYTATFYEKTALQLGFRVELVDVIATDHTSYDRVMLVFAADSNEEVFGLGEQFSFWSLRGQRVPIVSR